MKKNIIIITNIVLVLIIIGLIIYQENYINKKIEEINNNLEYLQASANQQDIQISQITDKQRELEQKEYLNNIESEAEKSFENPSTDGITPITKDEAKKIWEEYLTNTISVNINDYDVSEINTTMVAPNNCFTANGGPFITADFERSAYLLRYVKKDKLEEIIGYVDMYTGKVIGGAYRGN